MTSKERALLAELKTAIGADLGIHSDDGGLCLKEISSIAGIPEGTLYGWAYQGKRALPSLTDIIRITQITGRDHTIRVICRQCKRLLLQRFDRMFTSMQRLKMAAAAIAGIAVMSGCVIGGGMI